MHLYANEKRYVVNDLLYDVDLEVFLFAFTVDPGPSQGHTANANKSTYFQIVL